MREKTSPPHFSSRNLSIYRAFNEGGVRQTGHSTPHLTPPSFYFEYSLFQESYESENLRGNSDLLSEVLGEVFDKHLTL